jgi:hypothetical protein
VIGDVESDLENENREPTTDDPLSPSGNASVRRCKFTVLTMALWNIPP